MKLCLQCGEENSARARFCQACGEPLGETFVREDRRTVTVLYSDVVGSTRLSGRLGPEAFRRFMEAYIRAVREVIGRHGGTVEKFIGDAVVAIFGVPELHEDDAIRGVRAASELHAALEPLATELRLRWNTTLATRTAVNTGEVAAGGGGPGEPLVTGDVVNIAARLERAAGPDDVLLGPETYRLVRDLVRVEPLEPLCLRGIDEPVAAYRFVELSIGAGPPRKFDSPLIGRDHEIGLLQEAFDRVVAKHRCELFTVLGAVGVGKSRLVAEFAHAIESEALVLTGRCPSYGEANTFWPLAQIVRQALDISDGDPPAAARTKVELSLNGRSGGSEAALQLAELIGLADMDGPARERFWAVGKWFHRLAEHRPVVVMLDDIHWAEATFLQLIKDIAVLAAEVPLLVVCVARTELLEQHHGWLEEEESAASVMLAPLADDECARLVRYVLGGEGASEEVQTEIVKSAQGNPLFLQEMLAMLLDEGLLVDRDGRYVLTITPAMMRVPPTIHALLAARLDRLSLAERAVIESASVVGDLFYASEIAEILGDQLGPEVLGSLCEKELIGAEQSRFLDDAAFRFRHTLIREVAYEGLAQERRAQLHEQLADYLAAAARGWSRSYQELVGYHYERAHDYRVGLGFDDERAAGLGAEAAVQLCSASRKAHAAKDMPAAASLLGRAVALTGESSPNRLELLPVYAEALAESGDNEAAFEVATAAIEEARRTGRPGIESYALTVLLKLPRRPGFRLSLGLGVGGGFRTRE
jgi:class 3 adenylate cyclase